MKQLYIILMVVFIAVIAGSSVVDAEYLGELPSVINPISLEDGQYSVGYEDVSANVTLLHITKDEMLMRVISNPEAPAFKFSQVDGTEIPAILMLRMGDTNDNGYLDMRDFVVLSNAYGNGKESSCYRWIVDFDLDGRVGFTDYLMFVKEYGR
ncbi:MAG: EF-hand domain-containing protein [Methanolobus sp.]|uniref:EF-hand domain-containing protein n=1 Tax=Methanolobus sp. TaxID=1874737 RepID=UPI002730F630|nr:EF-hand domain-containing protein [Methanolobus sp.]MDP2217383.1 EF-hand domain-containing protein [Methanolobus sp.]